MVKISDPTSATTIPHLLGITLGTSGVAKTQVVAKNRTTGDTMTRPTDANEVVVFDAAGFTSGYSAGDVIEFQNVGASVGGTTITINSAAGGFQSAELTAAGAATTAVNL